MNELELVLHRVIDGLEASEERLASVLRFFSRTASTAARVAYQCELVQEVDLTLAVDFCEIVDFAHRSAFRQDLESELRDLAFSWFTIEDFLAPSGSSGLTITLLPPTMQEILGYLRRSLTYNTWATELLERATAGDLLAKPSLLTDIQHLLHVPERVAHTVLQLTQCAKFRSAVELEIPPAPEDATSAWMAHVSKVRPKRERQGANKIDAENLAIVCEFNRVREKSTLQLLTRTEALHKVGSRGADAVEVETNVSVRQRRKRRWIEILLAPRAYALWTILERDSPGKIPVVWRAAKAVKTTCSTLEDALGQLANARRMDLRVTDVVSALGEIDRELQTPAYRHHISRFQHIAQKDADIEVQLLELGALDSETLNLDASEKAGLQAAFQEDALAAQAIGAREVLREAYAAVASLYKGVAGKHAAELLRFEPLADRPIVAAAGPEELWVERVYSAYPEDGAKTVALVDRTIATDGLTAAELRGHALLVMTIYERAGRATVWWRARATIDQLLDVLESRWDRASVAILGRDAAGEWFGVLGKGDEDTTLRTLLRRASAQVAALVSWTMTEAEVTWEQAAGSHVAVESSFIGVRCPCDAIATWLHDLRRTLPLDVRRGVEVATRHTAAPE
jgi:hypothetical protein